MKHFTIAELTRSNTAIAHNIDNTPPPGIECHLKELVDNILDPFREYINRPINVTSGYRCPKLNKLVGGSSTSSHMMGWAADVQCSTIPAHRLKEMLVDFLNNTGKKWDQIAYEKDLQGNHWVHVGFKSNDGRQRCGVYDWTKK